jgi:hypothetical protein
MSSVGDLREAFRWSISKISEAFSLDRATVRKRIEASGISPAGQVRGNPVYALRDVGPALFQEEMQGNSNPLQDPSQMPPKKERIGFSQRMSA